MMLGRPCGYYLPGSTGLGGYFGVSLAWLFPLAFYSCEAPQLPRRWMARGDQASRHSGEERARVGADLARAGPCATDRCHCCRPVGDAVHRSSTGRCTKQCPCMQMHVVYQNPNSLLIKLRMASLYTSSTNRPPARAFPHILPRGFRQRESICPRRPSASPPWSSCWGGTRSGRPCRRARHCCTRSAARPRPSCPA